MTVDVEEYFQVSAFEPVISQDAWPRWPSRLDYTLDRTLQIFSDNDVKATFFTLGWICARHPHLVQRIADAGHEVGSHGYQHVRVNRQGPDEFRRDVRRTRHLLEDTTGRPVLGYRAASFSFDSSTPWAYEILADEGHRYSSSTYPIAHDHYGDPDAPATPYEVGDTGLVEIPLSTLRAAGRNWPCAGGGYFRLLPYQYSRWAIETVNETRKVPVVFYFHPWELDPNQPRVLGISLKTRVRHYINLGRFERRLQMLVREFRWGRMDSVFSNAACSQDARQ